MSDSIACIRVWTNSMLQVWPGYGAGLGWRKFGCGFIELCIVGIVGLLLGSREVCIAMEFIGVQR